MEYSFHEMLNDLNISREIEFDYKGHHYAIVNGDGKWFFAMINRALNCVNLVK